MLCPTRTRTCRRATIVFLRSRRRPYPTLFPYTTLFRSFVAPAAWRVVADAPIAGLVLRDPVALASGALQLRAGVATTAAPGRRSEEHTSELQSQFQHVCRLLLVKKNTDAVPNPNENLPKSDYCFLTFAPTTISYTLSLHDALPIFRRARGLAGRRRRADRRARAARPGRARIGRAATAGRRCDDGGPGAQIGRAHV